MPRLNSTRRRAPANRTPPPPPPPRRRAEDGDDFVHEPVFIETGASSRLLWLLGALLAVSVLTNVVLLSRLSIARLPLQHLLTAPRETSSSPGA
jgi:hypothetical protein